MYSNRVLLKSLLFNGRFSIAIFDDKLLDYLKKEYFIQQSPHKQMQVSHVPLGMRIIPSKHAVLERFNKAIEQMKKDKTIDIILQKYQ